MKRRLLSPPVLLVCGLLLAFLAISWNRLAAVEMSWHGWVALGLGSVLSLALAGVLMTLLFRSNRSGTDETVRNQTVRQPTTDGDSSGEAPDGSAPTRGSRDPR